jgi:hypothetical protein
MALPDGQQEACMRELEVSRRRFLGGSAAAVGGLAATSQVARAAAPDTPAAPVRTPEMVDLVLEVNGRRHALTVEPRTSLLDALREELPAPRRVATAGRAAPAPCMSTAGGSIPA